MEGVENSNFKLLRDCFASPLVEKSAQWPSEKNKKARGNGRRKATTKANTLATQAPNDAEDLAEFIDYIASEIFTSLPSNLRTLTYSTWLNEPVLQTLYKPPLTSQAASLLLNTLPPTINDSLVSYNFLPPQTSLDEFLTPVLNAYLMTLTTAPPPPSMTRNLATGCEICLRSWIPLTYHHLIPKDVHAKAIKRGWHCEDQLQNVAWICRACHSFVHRAASNEELAKERFTVERLLEREDVRAFATWVGKVRWKAS